jgi:hypothetical protein
MPAWIGEYSTWGLRCFWTAPPDASGDQRRAAVSVKTDADRMRENPRSGVGMKDENVFQWTI